jgi:LysM repeat protein
MNDKLKKGLITVSLSVSLLFATSVNDVQAVEVKNIHFTDIEGHWASYDIAYIQKEGLLFPIEDTSFLPQKDITRAEFVTMIVRALGLDMDLEVNQPFEDVDLEEWYTLDIIKAKNYGLVVGDAEGLFRPHDPVTRAEMATLITRAFSDLDAVRPSISFIDVPSHYWAYDAIAFSSKAGIIVGHNDFTFKPLQNASRAEAAVMVSRIIHGGFNELPPMLEYVVKNGDSLWEISEKFEVYMESIREVNQLEDDKIIPGQVLSIPTTITKEVLSSSPEIELIEWSEASQILSIGKAATITDVYTGNTFQIKRTYGANHADVEPLTKEDTATMYKIWGGPTWDTRPIIVEVDGRRLAAAMHNMPHSVQKIRDNNYNGHSCIHFSGSRKHHDNSVWAHMQRDVKIAAESKMN